MSVDRDCCSGWIWYVCGVTRVRCIANDQTYSFDNASGSSCDLDRSRLWKHGQCAECILRRSSGLAGLGSESFDSNVRRWPADIRRIWDAWLRFSGREERASHIARTEVRQDATSPRRIKDSTAFPNQDKITGSYASDQFEQLSLSECFSHSWAKRHSSKGF